ncbi:MAG: 30S ribosomal protein S8e [Candidatus ainarchaeum sp.]|nr:30S ribosomal protein S8e [Candidatus ainarchaeum sp.]
MVQWHGKSKKLSTGGKRNTISRCDKKSSSKGGQETHTKAQEGNKEENRVKKGRGTTTKTAVTSTKFINVLDNGKMIKAEIINVKENDANRLFARSNIATKGAILRIKIDSKEKEAKVTNRPGQDGVINAIVVE